MKKTFFISWAVAFVLWMVGSFVIHGVLLGDDYKALSHMFRSDQESEPYMLFMLFAHVLLSGAFVYIFSRGREDRPWLGQGLRFGLSIAFLTAIPMYMIYYVVQPMPEMLVVKQMMFESILLLALGVVTAFMYRGK